LIGNTLQKKKGIFGEIKDMQTMFAFGFSKSKGSCYAGTINGQIYVWKDQSLEEIIPNAHEGSIFCVEEFSSGFITAGKDGSVRTWDLNFQLIETIDLKGLLNQNNCSENFLLNGGRSN
jgi:WD40 repeat protein